MSRRKIRNVSNKVLVAEPHEQSRASLVLLKREYRKLDPRIPEYEKWLAFRLEVLAEREVGGPLYCFYCGCGPLLAEVDQRDARCATLDHVVPVSKAGPKYDRNNLVVSCQPCNQSKKDMPLEEFLKTQNIPLDRKGGKE